jgi:hypothetical protein
MSASQKMAMIVRNSERNPSCARFQPIAPVNICPPATWFPGLNALQCHASMSGYNGDVMSVLSVLFDMSHDALWSAYILALVSSFSSSKFNRFKSTDATRSHLDRLRLLKSESTPRCLVAEERFLPGGFPSSTSAVVDWCRWQRIPALGSCRLQGSGRQIPRQQLTRRRLNLIFRRPFSVFLQIFIERTDFSISGLIQLLGCQRVS